MSPQGECAVVQAQETDFPHSLTCPCSCLLSGNLLRVDCFLPSVPSDSNLHLSFIAGDGWMAA